MGSAAIIPAPPAQPAPVHLGVDWYGREQMSGSCQGDSHKLHLLGSKKLKLGTLKTVPSVIVRAAWSRLVSNNALKLSPSQCGVRPAAPFPAVLRLVWESCRCQAAP